MSDPDSHRPPPALDMPAVDAHASPAAEPPRSLCRLAAGQLPLVCRGLVRHDLRQPDAHRGRGPEALQPDRQRLGPGPGGPGAGPAGDAAGHSRRADRRPLATPQGVMPPWWPAPRCRCRIAGGRLPRRALRRLDLSAVDASVAIGPALGGPSRAALLPQIVPGEGFQPTP